MKKKIQHILIALFILLSSSIFFTLAYIGFKNQDIDLSTLTTHVGNVCNLGDTNRNANKARKSMIFFIDIKGLNQRLGIYRTNSNYIDLHRNIHMGDKIKVYFKKHHFNEIVNIDLVQIEKNGTVIYSKSEYEKKESTFIWIGLMAGFITIILSILYIRRKILGNKLI
jgi:hypothetical protein